DPGRHHRIAQVAFESLAHRMPEGGLLGIRKRPLRHNKAEQDLILVCCNPYRYCGVLHTGQFEHAVFDLIRFDTHAANLDLRVRAPENLDLSIGTNSAQIAGEVDEIFRVIPFGIWAEEADYLCPLAVPAMVASP